MELLSPVGNFDNLIAAVQNGADAVYLGASNFNARAGAENFDSESLRNAIMYARKRGVDVHLTLNTLLYNNEIKEALEIARFAYECGVSAIIVQDIGLANELVKKFPDLPIHASTQMTISNIYGVKLAEKIGLKRVVLARELSLNEIANIRENTNLELECFGHGALCVSYSGQCLFSSIVGKRSGNRGLCAGPCRLNYNLLKNGKNVESGYLLSTKDICTLQILPQLIDCGIDSLKIEGRKKSYEYVSIVTKIYRKYIDLAMDKSKEYKVEEDDMKQILQIYNRGGMGTGYFENRKNIAFPEKPNHLGVYIGTVKSINQKRNQITLDLKEQVQLGDVISINDNTSYISEIINGSTVGEIKNIKVVRLNDKVYRIVSTTLNKKQWEIYKKEVRKVDISAKLYENKESLCLDLFNEKIKTTTVLSKEDFDVNSLDNDRIKVQIQKTGNTIFNIKNIEIDAENLKLPISKLNNLRREAIEQFEKELENSITREYTKEIKIDIQKKQNSNFQTPKINLFLQNYDSKIDYSKFDYNQIYVQFKDLISAQNFKNCIVVLPNIIDEAYEKLITENLQVFDKAEAVMISHLSQVELLNELKINKPIYADYTLNIFNNLSENILQNLEIARFAISPELDRNLINELGSKIEKELVVYGRECLMTSKYCPIGKNENCNQACQKGKFELKDRKNFVFPVVSDITNCHARIYNSRIMKIDYKNIDTDFIRIDILNESQEEIEKIIFKFKNI